jgi:hypothetical protein
VALKTLSNLVIPTSPLETAVQSSKSFRPSSKILPTTIGRALVTSNVQAATMPKPALSFMELYVHTLHHCNLATRSLYSSTLRLLGYWSTYYTYLSLHQTFTVSLNLFDSLSFTSYENSLSSPQNLTWTDYRLRPMRDLQNPVYRTSS